MSKPCTTLKDIINDIKAGKDIEQVIPYDLSTFDKDCIIEILALYVKYGKNNERLEICKRGLDYYASRANG